MRLISFRTSDGHDALGVVAGSSWIAASALLPGGPATMEALLRGPSDALDALRRAADPDRIARDGEPLDGAPLLAPVPRPGKVVAIGRNYKDHAAESGSEPPAAPLIFAKWPSSVIGPGDEIRWDPALTDPGRLRGGARRRHRPDRAARVGGGRALDHVLGYTCVNDVSARDLQFGDGQWVRGKSLDTFCPMGPVVVTTDEIPDPQVAGDRLPRERADLQQASTADMYFGVATIVSHCSQAFTLEPGDVIATGTPAGVGVFRDPPVLLGDGDEVVVEIEGIGRLVNTCRFDRAAAPS